MLVVRVKYRNKIIGLLVIGFCCLFTYAILSYCFETPFFLEIFGFLFSFSLWEAFDCFIYTFSDIKTQREDVSQNLLLDIDFHEGNDFS